jgi:hypothetical protein
MGISQTIFDWSVLMPMHLPCDGLVPSRLSRRMRVEFVGADEVVV